MTSPGNVSMSLNEDALTVAETLVARRAELGVTVHEIGGARVVDCGVHAAGGAEAGLLMARAALAGRAAVSLVGAVATRHPLADAWPGCPWPAVVVESAAPIAACLAAQYAGWKVAVPGFFALCSGPIRAAIGREDLFDVIGMRERPDVAVGLLECSTLPPAEVCRRLAEDAGVTPRGLVLLVARTASEAGTLQVVARSLETALHKLHDVGYDVTRVRRGRGAAPLPPVPCGDDLAALGRTNDAILYGGHVVLDVDDAETALDAIGPRAVSRSSAAHGRPFLELFEAAGRDFYALDPALFAPAVVDLVATKSGARCRHGGIEPALVARSFVPAGA